MVPSSNSYGQIQSSVSQGQIQGGQGDSMSNIQAQMIQPLPYLQQMNIEQEEAPPGGKQRSRQGDLDVVIENHSQRRNQFQNSSNQVMQALEQQVEQIASNHMVRQQMPQVQNQGFVQSNHSSQRAVPDEKQSIPQSKEWPMGTGKLEGALDDAPTFQNKPIGGQTAKASKAKQLHAPYLEQVPQYSEMQSHEHATALEQVDAADGGEDSKAAIISISIQSEELEEAFSYEVPEPAQTTAGPQQKQGAAEQQLHIPMNAINGVTSHASSESSMVYASQVPMPVVGQLSQQARALKDSLVSPAIGQEKKLTASPGGRNSKHSSRLSHHTKGTGSQLNDNMTVHDCNSFNDKDGSEYTYQTVSNISQSPSHISHNTAAGLDRSPKYAGKLHPPAFNQQRERRQFTKKGSYEHMSEASLGSKDNAGGAKGETAVEDGLGPDAEAGESRRQSLFAGGGESLGPAAGPRASSLGRSEPKTGQEEGQMANVQVLASDATETGVFQINAATPLQAVDEMMHKMMKNKIQTRIAKMHSQPHTSANGRPPMKPEQSGPSSAVETRELKHPNGSPSGENWNHDNQADGPVSAKPTVAMKQLKRFQSLEAPDVNSGDLISTATKERQVTEQVDDGDNEQQQFPPSEENPNMIEENLPQADRESQIEQPIQGQQHQQDLGPDDTALEVQEAAAEQVRRQTQAFRYIDSRRNPVNDNLKALVVSARLIAFEASLAAQPKVSKKKEKNAVRWQSLGRDQTKQALQPQESNQNSLQVDPKLRTALAGIPLDYEVVALLQPTYFGETYLITMDKVPSKQHAEGSQAAANAQAQAEASPDALGQNQEIQNEDVLEYHILKVLDTSKTLKKEKPAMLKAIGAMMHVEHPAVASYQRFFMSSDFVYYISKLKTKIGSEKKSTRIENFEDSKVKSTEPGIQSVSPIEQAHANLLTQPGHPLREITEDLPCTLSQALITYQETLTLRQIARIALDLLFAVQFIHSKDIIHLDINLFNILIQARDPCEYLRGMPAKEDRDGQENGQATKTDRDGDDQSTNSSQQEDTSNIVFINFCQTGQYTKRMRFSAPEEAEIGKGGPARTSDTSKQHQNQILNINASGISFMSPERLTGNIKPEEVEMGKQADIWSIGVIIYLLFVGRLPFKGETCREIYENIKKCELKFSGGKWARVPDSAKALLAEMLCDDPIGRIDAASAVNHPFFQEVGQDPGVDAGVSEGAEPIKREAVIGKNIQRLLSKLQLVDQICMYHYVLEQSGNLIRAHFSAFASQIAKAKSTHKTVCMEGDSDEEAEEGPMKASSTQLMEQVEGLILQAEEAEIGLSHILGDKGIAKWFVQQLIKSRRDNSSSGHAHQQLQGNEKQGNTDQHLLLVHARLAKETNQDFSLNNEHGVKHNSSHEIEEIQQIKDDQDSKGQCVTFKELLLFSLDLQLGKIDRQLQYAYITSTEVHDDAATLIKDCLKMALNIHTSHHQLIQHQQGAEPNSFNALKQLIYLHAVDELHLAHGDNGGLHPSMTDLIFGDLADGKMVNPNSIKWSQAPSEQ